MWPFKWHQALKGLKKVNFTSEKPKWIRWSIHNSYQETSMAMPYQFYKFATKGLSLNFASTIKPIEVS